MTVITPSYHAEQYSPEDNRHDLRQFLCKFWFFSRRFLRLIGRFRSILHLGVQEDGGQCQILGVQGLDCREGTEEEC